MTDGVIIQFQGLALNGADEGATVPAWVQLTPPGPALRGVDGRAWNLADPQALVDLFKGEGQTLPVDIAHATEIKAPKGDPAPAVGWIVDMEVRDRAVWAKVDWNAAGEEAIRARAYRYLSPAFWVDRKTMTPVRLRSAGLTNTPNFHMAALNAAATEEDAMSLAEIRNALGLKEDADEGAILSAINTMKSSHETALNAARAEVDPAKFVPTATYQTALNRAESAETELAGLKKAAADEKIETAVNVAIEGGKIAPADKDFYLAACQAEGGLERFEAWVKTTPSVAANSQRDFRRPEGAAGALTDADIAACHAMGMTQEEFLKAKQAEAGKEA